MNWLTKVRSFFDHKPKRHTVSHHRMPCPKCGREVAHTQGGIPFLHNCRPLEVPRASNE